MILLLAACAGPGGPGLADCPEPITEAWAPRIEDELRAGEGSATWSGDGVAVDPDATAGCETSPCLTVEGAGRATTSMLLNRGVDYHLSGRLDVDVPGALEAIQRQRDGVTRVVWSETWAEPVQLVLDGTFRLTGAGNGVDLVLTLDEPGRATLDDWALVGPQWAAEEGSSEAPVSLGFLMHVEESQGFETDEAKWRLRARILEGYAELLARYGARLNVQPDATFVRGAILWDPGWLDRMEALGADWSVHLHDESGGAESVEAAARDARRAFEAAGREVNDVNGGFGLGPWSNLAAAGFTSLSAFKSPETQLGLALGHTQPWRPADGTNASDEEAFGVHDPDGPLVYVPGLAVREADHARFPELVRRVYGQAAAHARPGLVNTWYFIDHVDAFGPYDDDEALAAWLDDGSFEAELALIEPALRDVLPGVTTSRPMTYSTPPRQATAFLAFEATCR